MLECNAVGPFDPDVRRREPNITMVRKGWSTAVCRHGPWTNLIEELESTEPDSGQACFSKPATECWKHREHMMVDCCSHVEDNSNSGGLHERYESHVFLFGME